MNLGIGTIRPGTVLKANADGTIKAFASGLFSSTDSVDLLPPIYPWKVNGCNSFSSVEEGEDVWIMSFSDNIQELFWFRKDDISTDLSDLLSSDYKNLDVVMRRDAGDGWAQLYFSDGSGWVLSRGESSIRIKKNGDVVLTNGMPHHEIKINSSGIEIGGGTSPAVLGDKLQTALNSLQDLLLQMQNICMMTPYLTPLSTVIEANINTFSNACDDILSKNVKLD